MPELALVIRIDRELKTDGPEMERLEARIEEARAGEVAGSMSGLEETIVFVDLPPYCLVSDLPERIAMLEKILAESELAGTATVKIPEDADDSWDDHEDGAGE
jgi:hypothetical protein